MSRSALKMKNPEKRNDKMTRTIKGHPQPFSLHLDKPQLAQAKSETAIHSNKRQERESEGEQVRTLNSGSSTLVLMSGNESTPRRTVQAVRQRWHEKLQKTN